MIANLRNYEPETIEFVVPDAIREKFPPVLFEGSTDVDELIKINENFKNRQDKESPFEDLILDIIDTEKQIGTWQLENILYERI